jgi:hypothetical protein
MSADLFMERSAEFADGHRLVLHRVWDPKLPTVAWLMCNPSIGDGLVDDPTIRRVIQFSREHYGGSCAIVNLWSLVTPYPADLWPALGSIDHEAHRRNQGAIQRVISTAFLRVVAFGAEPMRRDPVLVPHLIRLFTAGIDPFCLGTSDDGWPLHPLARGKHAIPNGTRLRVWEWPGMVRGENRRCESCGHWSPWLSNAGDCMAYAKVRRDGLMSGASPSLLPPLPAPVTVAGGLCPSFEEL